MWTALAVLVLIAGSLSMAQAEEASPAMARQPGREDGTYFWYGAGLFVPPEGGRLGFVGSGEIAHDYVIGRISLAPGLRLAAYFGHEDSVGLGMATLRCVLPLEQASLFISAGAGPAYRTAPATMSAGLQVGVGLQIAISARVAIGVEASYLQLTSDAFREISVGPHLRLNL